MRGCKAFGSITKKSAVLACPSCVGLVAMDLQSITTRPKAGLRTLQDVALSIHDHLAQCTWVLNVS